MLRVVYCVLFSFFFVSTSFADYLRMDFGEDSPLSCLLREDGKAALLGFEGHCNDGITGSECPPNIVSSSSGASKRALRTFQRLERAVTRNKEDLFVKVCSREVKRAARALPKPRTYSTLSSELDPVSNLQAPADTLQLLYISGASLDGDQRVSGPTMGALSSHSVALKNGKHWLLLVIMPTQDRVGDPLADGGGVVSSVELIEDPLAISHFQVTDLDGRPISGLEEVSGSVSIDSEIYSPASIDIVAVVASKKAREVRFYREGLPRETRDRRAPFSARESGALNGELPSTLTLEAYARAGRRRNAQSGPKSFLSVSFKTSNSLPSPSPSSSVSASPSVSASTEPSATSSARPSASSRPSASASPRASQSSSPKPSVSGSASPSASFQPSVSSSPEPSQSSSPAPSASSAASPSASSQPSVSSSPAPSQSAFPSASPSPSAPSSDIECADGIDNDGDGHADFPDDPGCESSTDDNEGFDVDLTFFIDPSAGSDTGASGLSPSDAFATLARAMNEAALHLDEKVLIVAADGEYTFSGASIPDRQDWLYISAAEGTFPRIGALVLPSGGSKKLLVNGFDFTELATVWSFHAMVYLQNVSDIRFYHSRFSTTNPSVFVHEDFPYIIKSRSNQRIWLIGNEIVGGRYGVAIWGEDFLVRGNDIHSQFVDALRLTSLRHSVVEKNVIRDHDTDTENYGDHMDAIQSFPVGPPCLYPQTSNVTIRDNLIYNMEGQMIFLQANWVDDCGSEFPDRTPLGQSENVIVTGNVLAKKMDTGGAVPIQIQNHKDFVLSGNTVDGSVLIRANSRGTVFDNLFGRLSITENSEVTLNDFNVYGDYSIENSPLSVPLGENVIVRPFEFVDAADAPDSNGFDFTPSSDFVCTASSSGGHVGAVPCLGCQGSLPIARFGAAPLRGRVGTSFSFSPGASTACDGSTLTNFSWDYQDGTNDQRSLPDVVSHSFSEPGTYAVELTVTDSAAQSTSSTQLVTVLPPADPNLIAYYQMDGALIDISDNGEEGSWNGAALYTSGVSRDAIDLDGASYVSMGNSGIISGVPQLSVSMWAKKSATSGTGTLIQKHASLLMKLGEDSFTFTIAGGDDYWGMVTANVPAIQSTDWVHYAVVYDGALMKGYVNGVFVGQRAKSGPNKSGGWPMNLGSESLNPGDFFEGAIDQVIMYNRALSDSEVQSLANLGR